MPAATPFITGAPPATELDAVNKIMACIGEAPILSLDDPLPADADAALRALGTASTTCQMYGWSWNTIPYYTMIPDSDGLITVGPHVLKFRSLDDPVNQVLRGQAVYDRGKQTSLFTAPIHAEITEALPFSDCPPAARIYITAQAALVFQSGAFGNPNLSAELSRASDAAWADLMQHESEVSGYSATTGSDLGQDIFSIR